ncbi:MAG: helix-turn-helix domain-containing protein [Sulfitobacter sp.]
MSEHDLNRIEGLSQVTRGAMTAVTAANVLGLSRRRVQRLLKDFQTDGPPAIRHKARGRQSNNRIDPAILDLRQGSVRDPRVSF